MPQTLVEDGDPIDVLIVGSAPVVPGAVVRCRPIGALTMQDEKGPDEKIVAVPVDDLHPYSVEVRSHRDLPAALRSQITHFFSHYKDLKTGKWVKISDWVDAEGRGGADDGGDRSRRGLILLSRPALLA